MKISRTSGSNPQDLKAEIVDGHAILRLPVSGFERLSFKDKMLAYHLYQAAAAGRDINFDQNHRHALPIKNLCEEILLHSKGVDRGVLNDIAHYLKLQYLNAGIYAHLTFAKILPPSGLTFEKLSFAAQSAQKNGAKFMLGGKSLNDHLAELRPAVFDPKVEPYCTSRSPGPGEDLLTASANNYYERGLREHDLKGFAEKYPLNSKVVRNKGKLEEKVYRAGDPTRNVPPGLYAEQLSAVISHLEAALPFAHEVNARALRRLIEFYRTGDNETFAQFNIAWLEYDRPTVDTINGFIEEYRDAREKKGAWEGTVFFINEGTSGWLREIAAKADQYESHAPFADAYKRRGIKPIANMVEVLIETGDGGPISWSGVNLPNDQSLRQKYGSKNVLLWNARTTKEAFRGEKWVHEFIYPPDQEIVLKHRRTGAEILVGFHEALGHASGKQSDRMKGTPRDHLPGFYSWLEEERADLLALHHAWDPETFRIRKDWTEEAARALYKSYPASEMMNLAELPEGAKAIEEPHAVGGNFAVHYFMKKGVVREIKEKIGGRTKTFWMVPDENISKMREAVAELLRELQRIKSEGDLPAIRRLAEEFDATQFDPDLAAEIRRRNRELGLPSYYAYIFPQLDLVHENGKPKDVKISYAESFLRQQMAWSGYSPTDLERLPSRL
ncbi:MAG TPA: peptidase M49 [Bdellovibrionota bacterium]|nr:peptidase M49 [Bdellovibrionota bacterium]